MRFSILQRSLLFGSEDPWDCAFPPKYRSFRQQIQTFRPKIQNFRQIFKLCPKMSSPLWRLKGAPSRRLQTFMNVPHQPQWIF